MKYKNIVIMGLGYIGLPTAALIAGKKIHVYGVDINLEIVNTINDGKIHIIEPDLEGLVEYSVRNNYLKAFIEPCKADVFIITVPTPFKDNYKPDISYIQQSINMILPYLEEDNLIIIESTSPVGTTEKMADYVFSKKQGLKDKLFFAYCPERVLPGRIIYELEHNDRVIGGINEASSQEAFNFYSLFVKGKLHITDARTAEMCKLVENSFRDVNIAFANELSLICDKACINVWELINLANKHPRVNILSPGVGVGGHCIAVDPWFLVHDYKDEARIIKAAREINNYKTEWVIKKISYRIELFKKNNNKMPKIACMGLSFKPNIDDLRESPALYVTENLIRQGYDIMSVEPNIRNHKKYKIYDYKQAVKEADIIVFLVAHKEFLNMDIKNKETLDFCDVHGIKK